MDRFGLLVEKLLEEFEETKQFNEAEFERFYSENPNGVIIYNRLVAKYTDGTSGELDFVMELTPPVPLIRRGHRTVSYSIFEFTEGFKSLAISIHPTFLRPLVFTSGRAAYSHHNANRLLFFNNMEEAELYYELNSSGNDDVLDD